MIINIRGTSGSGKSYVVRQIMERFGPAEVRRPILGESRSTKPLGYYLPNVNLFVPGSYENTCGGCDTIDTMDEVGARVKAAYDSGYHVLFEGVMVSSVLGRWIEMSIGKDWRWVFLDTPLDECLKRIEERRKARGDDRPVNPVRTQEKHKRNMHDLKVLRETGYTNVWAMGSGDAVRVISQWLVDAKLGITPQSLSVAFGTTPPKEPEGNTVVVPKQPLKVKLAEPVSVAEKPRLVLRRRS